MHCSSTAQTLDIVFHMAFQAYDRDLTHQYILPPSISFHFEASMSFRVTSPASSTCGHHVQSITEIDLEDVVVTLSSQNQLRNRSNIGASSTMSPSRGDSRAIPAQSQATTGSPDINGPQSTEAKAIDSENTALARARVQLSYLYNPKAATQAPGRFRTRALLRSLHYIGVFIFWRAVRWAKYAISRSTETPQGFGCARI